MIPRRLTEHVKAQNWFAVAIDFVIAVAGVFVGLQVSNWNAGQADKRLGRAYAARLTADLQSDLQSRSALVAFYGAVLDSVERTNALLADPASDQAGLIVSAYRASEINYAPQTRATWDEIVSSGDTGLLPRGAVESGVAAYYAGDTARIALDDVQNSGYRRRVRTILPLALQRALREGCSDERNDAQQIVGFMDGCTRGVAPGLIAETADALQADPVVLAELRYQYSGVFSARAIKSGDVIFLERALAALTRASPGGAEPVR